MMTKTMKMIWKYIKLNVAPVGMDAIMLNGTKFYLGTNVISGKLVLTLSTTPQNQ